MSFVTPGRRAAGSSPLAGSHSDGSSSKRVVRSALEVLMNTASPEINLSARKPVPAVSTARTASPPPRPPPAAASGNSGFTVTYATAAPASRAHAAAHTETTAASHSAAERRSDAPRVVREEPSALAFLSPNAKMAKRARSARPPPPPPTGSTSAAAQAMTRHHSAPRTVALTSPPQTSRNLYAEVEQASDDGRGDASRFARHTAPPSEAGSDDSEGTERAILLYSDEDVAMKIEAALSQYEQERDAEETLVLEQVAEEIESHKKRYEALRAEHVSLSATNETLQSRLDESEAYARTLEHKLAVLHNTSQAQRERADRLEVALRHEQDAKLLSSAASAGRSPPSTATVDGASSHTLRARIAELEADLKTTSAQLSDAEAECEQLKAAHASHAEEKQQFERDCEAIKNRVVFFSERMGEMEVVLREKNAQLQRVQRQLVDSRAEVQQMKRQASEMKPADVHRLTELETNLQQQTDEVRRRMHRITTLEHEKTALTEEAHHLRHSVCTAVTYQKRLEAELDKLARMLRLYLRKPQLWLLQPSALVAGDASETVPRSKTHTIHRRDLPTFSFTPSHVDNMGTTQTFTEQDGLESLLLSASDSNSATSDDDDDANSSGSLLSTPRQQRRARSSPAVVELPHGAAHAHRARTVSPRRHPHDAAATAPRASATSAHKVISKRRARDALREMGTQQSECLRIAQEAARNLASLHTKTQAYVARLQRKYAEHAAASQTAPQPAVPSIEEQVAASGVLHRLEEACRTLKTALAAKTSELEEVRIECELRGDDLRMLERHAHELQSALDAREAQRKESMTAANDQITAELQTVKTAAAKTETELTASRKECATLTDELHAARRDLSEAERSAQQRTTEWRDRESAMTSKLRRLEDEKASLEAALEEGKERIRELLAQLQGLRSQQATSRQRGGREQRELVQDLAQVRQQLASVTALHEANKQQLEKERTEHAAKAHQAQQQAETLQQKVSTLKRQVLQLTNDQELRATAEQSTLQILLDMLAAYRTREEVHESAASASTADRGRQLFHNSGLSDLLGEEADMAEGGRDTSSGPHREAVLVSSSTTPSPSSRPSRTCNGPSVGASLAQLSRCRGEVVRRVQRALLDLARLEQQPPHHPQSHQPMRGTRSGASPVHPLAAETPHRPHGPASDAATNDDRELVLHNCSYHDVADGETNRQPEEEEDHDMTTFVDDSFLQVLHYCCGAQSTSHRHEPAAFQPPTPAVKAGQRATETPLSFRERPVNVMPQSLHKARRSVAIAPATPREPHAHLLKPRTDAPDRLASSVQTLLSSPAAFASS